VRIAFVLVGLAGCIHDEHPVAAPTLAANPVPVSPPAPQVPRSGSLRDDLPHRRAEIAPKLHDDCLPRYELPPDSADDNSITIALDRLGDDLVACAQMITRRDVSVFHDYVSYACWNLDPKTGRLTRRSDLGRAYFRCQDGGCPAGDSLPAISYDGATAVTVDAKQMSITDRKTGAVKARFEIPDELVDHPFFRGDLTYLDHLLYARADDHVYVFDDSGNRIATLPGLEVQIVDDDLVLAIPDPLHATSFEPRTRAMRGISNPGCAVHEQSEQTDRHADCAGFPATHFVDAIRYHGRLYGFDQPARQLVELDPVSFRARRSQQLAICP
jgi:hypothetical protein